MAQSIRDVATDEKFAKELERYRKRAIELGAADAKLVSAADIVIDERVRGKCRYPTCPSYNTNMNCPPHTMSIDEFRTLVSRYRYAILFKVDVSSGRMSDFEHATRKTIMEIVWKLESEAFYDGHYFATGFGGTNCKAIFCQNVECAALAGKGCRHPFKARPAMHGVGIDAYRMAANAGWEMYPVGSSADGSSVPHLTSMGLVLID